MLLAEIEGIHAGLCIARPGPRDVDSLFVQVVAVVPAAQQRGIGLSLLAAAAGREPDRDIALAIQSSNLAAHAMNSRFGEMIGGDVQRVNLGAYLYSDLGIQRGQGYRVWKIKRPT